MAKLAFTKQAADKALDAAADIFDGLPRVKRPAYIASAYRVRKFLEAARKAAPSEKAPFPATADATKET